MCIRDSIAYGGQMRDAAGKNAEETVIVRKKGKVATAAEAEDARGRTAVVIPQ